MDTSINTLIIRFILWELASNLSASKVRKSGMLNLESSYVEYICLQYLTNSLYLLLAYSIVCFHYDVIYIYSQHIICLISHLRDGAFSFHFTSYFSVFIAGLYYYIYCRYNVNVLVLPYLFSRRKMVLKRIFDKSIYYVDNHKFQYVWKIMDPH